ncbi:hypothetical protein DFH28DRAFT_1033867 [Melampsora americana]|nr:hypothetical protein DFH28DRAFT_1033867 [Melampsora americana]
MTSDRDTLTILEPQDNTIPPSDHMDKFDHELPSWDLTSSHLHFKHQPQPYIESHRTGLGKSVDTYQNFHTSLGMVSNPDLWLPNSCLIKSLHESNKIVPEGSYAHFQEKFPIKEHYHALGETQENTDCHGRFTDTSNLIHEHTGHSSSGSVSLVKESEITNQSSPYPFASYSQAPTQCQQDILVGSIQATSNLVRKGKRKLGDVSNHQKLIQDSLQSESIQKTPCDTGIPADTIPLTSGWDDILYGTNFFLQEGGCDSQGVLGKDNCSRLEEPAEVSDIQDEQEFLDNLFVTDSPNESLSDSEMDVNQRVLPSSVKELQTHGTPIRKIIPILQKTGVFYVNNSQSLAYKTTDWFDRLKNSIIKQNNCVGPQVNQVDQAIKFAHQKVTMCFIGLIVIFANQGGDQVSLEALIQEGWNFIQSEFGILEYLDLNFQKIDKKGNRDPKCKNRIAQLKNRLQTRERFYTSLSWFRYLSNMRKHKRIRAEVLYFLVSRWDQNRTTSKIEVKYLTTHQSKIQEFHDSYVKYNHGGFYSRQDIKNIAFPGIKFFGESGGEPSKRRLLPEWYRTCMKLSHSAQFHSPIGFALCQEVHTFFVSLVDHLLSSYKDIYGCDVSSAEYPQEKSIHSLISDPHQININKILKAISMAEYRLTVVFIGLVRVSYQNELQEDTLQILLKRAWEFLKGIFSKWKEFQFDQDFTRLFGERHQKMIYMTKTERRAIDWTDPCQLFIALWQHQDILRYPMPPHGLHSLLDSWNHGLENSPIIQTNDPKIKIKGFLDLKEFET